MSDELARILLADADQDLCAVIADTLVAAGFRVDRVGRGDEAEVRIGADVPDLLIVELILDGLSGLDLCRRLRRAPDTMTLPIIVISDQNEERDRVGALTIGADDYLAKPFSLAELTARVHALLRRSAFRRPTDRIVVGDLALEPATRRVSRGGRLIHLGPLEYGLLTCIMLRPGQVFSRVQLLDLVWPDKTGSNSRTVDVHVGRLRRSLTLGGERDPVLTVRGEGYAFDADFGRG